ncbi:MAG TPA: monoamine oxidase, partial [Ktedonobacter sp.]|nr:monoamine oxidase [Ktedonobacter sp.]
RNHYYSTEELARDFQAIAPTIQQQFDEAGFPTTYNHNTEMGQRLDSMSAYEWVEQYVPGGHDSSLGRMLNGGCRGFYGLESSEQSALNLIYMFASRTFVDNEESNTGPMQGSSKIAGGNQRLP